MICILIPGLRGCPGVKNLTLRLSGCQGTSNLEFGRAERDVPRLSLTSLGGRQQIWGTVQCTDYTHQTTFHPRCEVINFVHLREMNTLFSNDHTLLERGLEPILPLMFIEHQPAPALCQNTGRQKHTQTSHPDSISSRQAFFFLGKLSQYSSNSAGAVSSTTLVANHVSSFFPKPTHSTHTFFLFRECFRTAKIS
jgi:hypothetical protein